MKNKLTLIPMLFAGLLALSIFSGCQSTNTITIEKVPAWGAQVGDTLEAKEVLTESLSRFGIFPQLSDSTFTLAPHQWVEEVLPWTWEFALATGIAYTPESFDCDKFAKAFTLAAEIATGRAGIQAQPLVARIYVRQKQAFGGVPGGSGNHALVGIVTDRGFFVIEPQSRAMIEFSKYPNRDEIYEIKIGG